MDVERASTAAAHTDSEAQRHTRLASFSSFVAMLTAGGDLEAAAAAAAGRRSGGAFRQPVEVEIGDARRELSPADTTLGVAGFSLERHGAGGSPGAGAERQYQETVQELVRARTGALHVFCSPAKVSTNRRAAV